LLKKKEERKKEKGKKIDGWGREGP